MIDDISVADYPKM